MFSAERYSHRLRALCDMDAAFLREYAGLHEDYDGCAADLSPSGIRSALARLGGEPLGDEHDEAQLACVENAMRVRFGTLEQHRWDPWVHLEALDLSQYERPYAEPNLRAAARTRQLHSWPDMVANAIESLDCLSAPVAAMFCRPARAMTSNILPSDGAHGERGLKALERLVAHLEHAAAAGARNPSLGQAKLVSLLGCEDGLGVNLDELVQIANREYERMAEIRADAAERFGKHLSISAVSERLRHEHGDFAEVLATTQAEVRSAARFCTEHELLPAIDRHCVVAEAPASRSWAFARVSWVGSWEEAGHSYFHIAPPAAGWSDTDRQAWLARLNRAAASVVAVHEAAPGHCSHALMVRRQEHPVRRTLWSELFFEGWAHYVEEMMWEEGYQSERPHYQFAMAEEAMMRAVRVLAVVGIHTGDLDLDSATRLFVEMTPLAGVAARAEAARALWEPTCVRYTWGKVLVRRLREAAKTAWGAGFSLARFHRELLGFGAPPVGVVRDALHLQGAV